MNPTELEFEYIPPVVHRIDEKITIIAIGDPHFKITNLKTIATYIIRVIESIHRENPAFVVILGDLLHEHEKIHTNVLNYAYDFIQQIRELVPVFVLVGNHDYINNQQFLTTNHWMNAMKEWRDVTIVDQGKSYSVGGTKFIFCPYVFPSRFEEALHQIDSDWKSASMVFAHQEILGCKMGAIVSTTGDKWELDYPFLVSGHIHDKQRIQGNVFYTGSSIQHAFGESHDKTIAVCTVGDTILVEKINLGLVSKKILYVSIDEMDTFDKLPTNGDQLRLTVAGSVDEFKTFRKTKKYKELTGSGVKIVYMAKPITIIAGNSSVEDQKKSFETILYEMIQISNSNSIRKIYEELIN